jgi:ketosteroid isomerase-like protein
MKNLIGLVAFLVPFPAAYAQENSALVTMVAAEKAFAADALTGGVQQAFMKYLDDSALVFENGQILNGKEVWKNRNTEGTSLIWYPEAAEVSSAGDLGYTTGPAQFRVSKDKKAPDYTGYFSSIWKKNKEGQWKVLLDMGSPAPPMEYNDSIVEYDTKATAQKGQKAIVDDLKKVEERFIAAFDNGKAYTFFGTSKTRYYRPRVKPLKGEHPAADSVRLQFRNAGTGVSSSGDLGYAYGYVTASAAHGNYLRVWKKEQDQWKIILDVASY